MTRAFENNSKIEFDEALDKAEGLLDDIAKKKAEFKPLLDRRAKAIQGIDDKIDKLEDEISGLKKFKMKELDKFQELLDSAGQLSHKLENGFRIMPDHRLKTEITDGELFMKWLKENCEPQEVLRLIVEGMKSTELKKFAQRKWNEQREKGIIKPSVDGINFGENQFNKLKTMRGKDGK